MEWQEPWREERIVHEKPAVPEQPHAMEMTLDNALAYALRLQQEGRIKGAVQLYTRILEQAPNHVDALHFLGLAQFQLGDGEAAVDWIRRAIALKPDFAGAYNNLGNVLKCLHHFADAAQAYHRVIELEPDNADAYNNLGHSYGRRAKRPRRRRCCAGLSHSNPNTPARCTTWATC